MSVHAHSKLILRGSDVGWNWEMALLAPIDLVKARFVAWPRERTEYADLLFEARPGEARFA